ncbi:MULTISPECIES: YfhE family protein [Bacillus]|uniref:YfhE family protein n=1 Tax=Bacillus pumilus TaxID=1408 RepID=A0A2G8IT75_BACPU|nr:MULTISPECIES: YfhE family protein [Bacillus]MCC9090340.1 YfhE family protein [Bacillus pumilus]MED1749843.1 YfhE family protein [Bacillus zhangzhouensis]PIK26661.1 YfhE family protein [Bacillus pumilus]UUD43483.1 YfhE family protein [Bacillus pumilus]
MKKKDHQPTSKLKKTQEVLYQQEFKKAERAAEKRSK